MREKLLHFRTGSVIRIFSPKITLLDWVVYQQLQVSKGKIVHLSNGVLSILVIKLKPRDPYLIHVGSDVEKILLPPFQMSSLFKITVPNLTMNI